MRRTDDRLDRVQHWIFDLDNTLYPAELGILDSLQERSVTFIEESLGIGYDQASELKQALSSEYGTIARGLELRYGIAQKRFHGFIHSVSLNALRPDKELQEILRRLPGEKLIHTNAPREHADAVLARLQVAELVDAIYAIEDAAGIPKPSEKNYQQMIARMGIDPNRSCFFDDQVRNLVYPKTIGMLTVLVSSADTAALPSPELDWQAATVHEFFQLS
nr:Alpha-D-glucose 1-phosphate phosphatase YihX [Cupriavidus sp.]